MSTLGQQRSVLVCASDLHVISALRAVLREAGFGVRATQTADDALTRAALRAPDAAIIEMDLIDSAGTEVCRRLREWCSIPLIILAQDFDEDRMLEAFQAGADDYITKPFRPRELVARLHARMRRAVVEGDEPALLGDGVRISFSQRVIHRGGREIRLTPIEYRLLSVLMRHRGRLLTHETLLRQVWGAAYAEDRQTLRAHMTNLRRKLGAPSATGVIRTYPGVGYLLEDHPTADRPRPSAASAGSSPRPGVRVA